MYSVVNVVIALLNFYELLIVLWCIASWIPRKPGGLIDDFSSVLAQIVEPYLSIFRRFIPAFAGIDFSPVIAVVVLGVVQQLVVGILI